MTKSIVSRTVARPGGTAAIDLTGETMKHAPVKLAGKLALLCPGYSNIKP